MKRLTQNHMEKIKDDLQQGLITVDEANLRMVMTGRVKLVTNSIPRNIRKVLNNAVKLGTLGHLKKDGHKPEAYYNIDFKQLAVQDRNKHKENIERCTGKVLGGLKND